jgi:large subunit ribosomal protein L5
MKLAKAKYKDEVIDKVKKEFKLRNVFEVPRIEKVVINCGMGKFIKEGEKVDEIISTITKISGQKPIKTKAKKAISGFKIREGLEVGTKVTLRGQRMWDFIDRLVNTALPRTRDFQGIDPKSFDSHGNLNLAIREQLIFPEISPEKTKHLFGFQITFVTTAKNIETAKAVFQYLGFPLKKDN